MKKIVIFIVIACTFLFVNTATATLSGYNVQGEYGYNLTGGPFDPGYSVSTGYGSNTIINPGIELYSEFNLESFDFNDTEHTITRYDSTRTYSNLSFVGHVFHFTNPPFPGISNVTLISSTVTGFDASRISFQSDALAYNLSGLSMDAGDQITLGIQTNAVPEPTSLLLLGSGLVGVMGIKRKLKM